MADQNLAGTSGFSVKSFYKTKNNLVTIDNTISEFAANSGSDEENSVHSESEYHFDLHQSLLRSNDSDSVSENDNENQSQSEEEESHLTLAEPAPVRGKNYQRVRRGRGRPRIRGGRIPRLNGGRIARLRSERLPRQRRVQLTDAELGWKNDKGEHNLVLPNFIAIPGIEPILDTTPNETPFDIFSFFYNGAIIDLIKKETNRYAKEIIDKERRISGQLKKKSVLDRWKTVTNNEIKIFFAIIFHMSLVIKPTINHYWSKRTFYRTNFCRATGMSRDRFLAIFTMLHVNNNATYIPRGMPNHNPLHKVQPIYERLIKLFLTVYTPTEHLTIDEGICPFRGRVLFKVYIKGKPHKYGIKLYMICEANSGFCCNFEIYTGAKEGDDEYNTVPNLINRLMDPYMNKGYTLYMDRYFSSPKIFDYLWSKRTKAVGTVMKNRLELPKNAFSKKMKKGEYIMMRRNHLLATKWTDNRDVYILSTIHNAEMLPSPNHIPNQDPILKPASVLSYNKYKVGVDRSDQLLSYNSFRRKSIKWWKKLFFHFIDLTMANSMILYNKSNPNARITLRKFYEEVCQGFLEAAGIDVDGNAPQEVQENVENLRLMGRDHFPCMVPATACAVEGKAQRKCKVCSEKGKRQTGKRQRKDTTHMCRQCNTPLCIYPCFELYHTKQKYWE